MKLEDSLEYQVKDQLLMAILNQHADQNPTIVLPARDSDNSQILVANLCDSAIGGSINEHASGSNEADESKAGASESFKPKFVEFVDDESLADDSESDEKMPEAAASSSDATRPARTILIAPQIFNPEYAGSLSDEPESVESLSSVIKPESSRSVAPETKASVSDTSEPEKSGRYDLILSLAPGDVEPLIDASKPAVVGAVASEGVAGAVDTTMPVASENKATGSAITGPL